MCRSSKGEEGCSGTENDRTFAEEAEVEWLASWFGAESELRRADVSGEAIENSEAISCGGKNEIGRVLKRIIAGIFNYSATICNKRWGVFIKTLQLELRHNGIGGHNLQNSKRLVIALRIQVRTRGVVAFVPAQGFQLRPGVSTWRCIDLVQLGAT